MLKLMKDCVEIWPEPVEGKICGSLMIKGPERELQINREMKEVLEKLTSASQSKYVFTSPIDPTKPLGPWVLEDQMAQLYARRLILIPMLALILCGTPF
jgi:hypothetical protein